MTRLKIVLVLIFCIASFNICSAADITYYPKFVASDSNGQPMAFGQVYSYVPGTTTPKATYTDSTGDVANTNPVVLDNKGEADIYTIGLTKLVLKKKVGSVYVTQWEETVEGSGAIFGNYKYPDYEAPDQGATDAIYTTVKDIIDGLAADEEATIFCPHNSGGVTTAYTFLTAETIPSNVTLEIEPGAELVPTLGTVIRAYPDNIDAGLTRIISGEGLVKWLKAGETPVEWFGALGSGLPADDDTASFQATDLAFSEVDADFLSGHTISVNSYRGTLKCSGAYYLDGYEPSNGITIQGIGVNSSYLVGDNATCIVMDNDVATGVFFTLRDIGVRYSHDTAPVNITNISRADPCVVTAPSHGLSDDDEIIILDLKGGGMGEIEDTNSMYIVKNSTANTFELYERWSDDYVDSTDYAPYDSGGSVYQTDAFAIRAYYAIHQIYDNVGFNLSGHGSGLSLIRGWRISLDDVLVAGVHTFAGSGATETRVYTGIGLYACVATSLNIGDGCGFYRTYHHIYMQNCGGAKISGINTEDFGHTSVKLCGSTERCTIDISRFEPFWPVNYPEDSCYVYLGELTEENSITIVPGYRLEVYTETAFPDQQVIIDKTGGANFTATQYSRSDLYRYENQIVDSWMDEWVDSDTMRAWEEMEPSNTELIRIGRDTDPGIVRGDYAAGVTTSSPGAGIQSPPFQRTVSSGDYVTFRARMKTSDPDAFTGYIGMYKASDDSWIQNLNAVSDSWRDRTEWVEYTETKIVKSGVTDEEVYIGIRQQATTDVTLFIDYIECYVSDSAVEFGVKGLDEQKVDIRYTSDPTLEPGYHIQGDIWYNAAPVTSGKIGWVCVTSGATTSAVFKTWGAID
jgi:hypothetical protein